MVANAPRYGTECLILQLRSRPLNAAWFSRTLRQIERELGFPVRYWVLYRHGALIELDGKTLPTRVDLRLAPFMKDDVLPWHPDNTFEGVAMAFFEMFLAKHLDYHNAKLWQEFGLEGFSSDEEAPTPPMRFSTADPKERVVIERARRAWATARKGFEIYRATAPLILQMQ